MRVLHVTQSLSGGGAAIAARRIFEATRSQPGIDAHLVVTSPLPHGMTDPHISYFQPRNKHLNSLAEAVALRLQKSINPAHRTLGLFPSGLADFILQGKWDLVHLHWMGMGTLSIKEIGQISRAMSTVWTLHDSWPFCGAEHHPHFENDERFTHAYSQSSRAKINAYIDIDGFVFRRKLTNWRSPIFLVAPTRYMSTQAKRSALTSTQLVATIPHPISPETFSSKEPEARSRFRASVGLNQSAPTVLFASSPGSDFNKGLDLLAKVVAQLHDRIPGIQLVTIGGPWPDLPDFVLQLPPVMNESDLASWLSAADLIIVPSRLESFSLVAAEAQMCDTPVISFDTSGLRDVVGAQRPDRLIPQWDWRHMADQAEKTLSETTINQSSLRNEVAQLWTPSEVGAAYVRAYQRAISMHNPGIRSNTK